MPKTIHIITRDNYTLTATLFEPTTSNGLSVLINSAMAVKQTYYAPYATYLTEQGFTVLTYDYRGIGESKPAQNLRGFEAHLEDWFDHDQNAVHQWLGEQFPDHKRLVIGHSFGGQIAGLTPVYPHIIGWMGVAAQSGYWWNWSGLARVRMFIIWFLLIPLVARIYGYLPAQYGMGQDVPKGVVTEWARACRHKNYFLDFFGQTPYNHFQGWQVPMLAYSFEDDDYAPRRTVDDWFGRYPQAKVTRRHVTPQEMGRAIGHFGFFRAEFKETLWAESAAWLKNPQ